MGYAYHKTLLTTDEIAILYNSGLSCKGIAPLAGIGSVAVWKRLRRSGFILRGSGTQKGTHWSVEKRGEEFLGADGRWWVRGVFSGKNRHSKRRAVVVMEKKLGNLIPKGYLVHHKNGDCTDDRLSNLKLIKKSNHNTRS